MSKRLQPENLHEDPRLKSLPLRGKIKSVQAETPEIFELDKFIVKRGSLFEKAIQRKL